MPAISVIIPYYDRERVILRAIRSIIEQSLPATEVILVDDGSKDDGVCLVKAKYPFVRIIRHECNKGAQAARATGIKAATGDWVAFLDSDDWWLPQKLEWQLAKAGEGFAVVHGSGLIRKNGVDELLAIAPLEGDIYAALLRQPAPLYPCMLVRRECFEKAGYPDPAISAYQEWDMSLLLARHYSFGYVDKPLFVYEVQKDSISKDDYRNLYGYEQIVRKWWKEIVQGVGAEAGFEHYRSLALQACRLTGICGYMHYLRLGARLLHKNFSAILLSESRSLLAHCKYLLVQTLPCLRTLWQRMRGKREI